MGAAGGAATEMEGGLPELESKVGGGGVLELTVPLTLLLLLISPSSGAVTTSVIVSSKILFQDFFIEWCVTS